MAIDANYNDGDLTSVSPYFNDWDETKKYLQMLFVPGRALQARELTQVQNILQSQIDRFGSHYFKTGEQIAGGSLTTNDKVHYVRLDPDAATDDVTDYSTLEGLTLSEAATGVKARVIHVDTTVSVTDPYPVLFVEYISASSDGLTTTFSNASVLAGTGVNVEVITSAQATATAFDQPSNGEAFLVSVDQGIYFIDGFFCLVDQQSYAPYTTSAKGIRAYTNTPTTRIGLTATKSTVDIASDATLGDPAAGSPNYSAPGAHRLKFAFTLGENSYTDGTSTIANTSAADFTELLRVVSGEVRITNRVETFTNVNDTLAHRTHDESGNYVVKPFTATKRQSRDRRTIVIASFSVGSSFTVGETVTASPSGGSGRVIEWDSGNNWLIVDLLTSTEIASGDTITGGTSSSVASTSASPTVEHVDIALNPGKAYINGREFETMDTEHVTLYKGRDVSDSVTESATCSYGNYFICSSLAGGLFDINEQEQLELVETSTAIGTCNVKHVEYDTTNSYYKVYVYNVVITTGSKSIADIDLLRSATTNANTATIDTTNGQDASNNTLLFGKATNTSVFEMNDDFIVDSSGLSSISYHYRVYQTAVSGTNNQIAFSLSSVSASHADDQYFPFTNTTTSDLATIRKNYIIVNDTTNTDITANITSVVTSGDSDTATINVSAGITATDTIHMIAVVKATAAPRVKILVEDYLIPIDMSMVSNEIALGISDVVSVSQILDVAASNADVTSKFILDTGQRDNVYDYAKLILKSGETVNGASGFTITCDYYAHSGSGPLTIDSYATTSYVDIPTYISSATGKVYNLASCVDFRPAYDNQFLGSSSSSSSPDTLDYAKVIIPSTVGSTDYNKFTATYNYYLPRIDKIVLTDTKEFKVIKGLSANPPKAPSDIPNALTLYTVEIPAFTENPDEINLISSDNQRYTMRDIGRLEERINNLEYYTSLSLLEREADSLLITDVNGAERFKNGILVDSFNGHNVGDVGSNYYACSMDFREGTLRPQFVTENVNLSYDNGSSTNVEQVGNQVTLTASSTKPLIEQPLSSSAISVNPFNTTNWMGSMALSPSTDTWFDTTTRPEVVSDVGGIADAYRYGNSSALTMTGGFGTEWNDWQTAWAGIDVNETKTSRNPMKIKKTGINRVYGQADSSTVTIDKKQSRKGIDTELSWEKISGTVGDRVLPTNIVQYMRAKTVTITASGMKPNTIVYPFFDGLDVTAYITGTLQTDADGDISLTFSIPAGIFKTGTKLFRLTDSATNITSEATTTAEAFFTARGIFDDWNPVPTRTDVSQERILENITERQSSPYFTRRSDKWTGAGSYTGTYVDPLAQSFVVDGSKYPNGIFLKSVDLFFQEKDSDLPVSIEIRPSANGYPDSSKVIPNSHVKVATGSVNTSTTPDPSDSATYTTFTFSDYVYLKPGEYHLVVLSNSSAYKAHIAQVGETQIGSTNRITDQPYSGFLFKPQTAAKQVKNKDASLTFRLNRCVFTTSAGEAIFNNDALSGAKFDVVQVLMTDKQFSGAPIAYGYKGTPVSGSLDSAYTEITANRNIYVDTQHELNTSADFVLRATMTTEDDAYSPVINVSRASLIAAENVINNSASGETSARPDITGSGASVRYMTRRVTLDQDSEATDINVYLTAEIPTEADVKVYYKAQAAEDDTLFDDMSWVEMTETTANGKTIKGQLQEYIYKPSTVDGNGDTTVAYDQYTDIQTFAIKIVLLTSNTSKPPIVHDMRAIAVA